jgi:hypothetical protein
MTGVQVQPAARARNPFVVIMSSPWVEEEIFAVTMDSMASERKERKDV